MTSRAFLFSLLAVFAAAGCAPSETGGLLRVKKDGKAYIGTVPFEPPLLYQDRQELVGPEAGLAAKISEKLTEKLGAPRPVEPFWITRTYRTLSAALANNEVDLVISVYGITEERKQTLDFSDSYYQSELVLTINPAHDANLRPNTLDGKKIGVRADTAGADKVAAKYSGSTIVPMATLDDAVLALKRGEVDAVIDDKHMSAYSLATTPGVAGLEIVPGVIDTVDCAVAVRKGDNELLEAVNAAIAEVAAQDQYAKWTQEHMGDRLQAVLSRHEERLVRAQRASQPRQVVIRVSRDRGSQFDVYRFANLNFVLTDQSTGQNYTASRIDFQGRTGVSSVRVPPGSYRVVLPKFNFTAGTVSIGTNDANRIGLDIRFRDNGTFQMTRS